MKQKHLRQNLKRERNQLLNRIHRLIAEEDMKDINGKVDVIEKMKEDSYRMFKAVNIIKNRTSKQNLLIETENKGLTSNEETQIRQITKFFQQFFNKENAENQLAMDPKPMTKPFEIDEIEKAVKSLKNNKCPGIDEISSEQIKYGPRELHEEITSILNQIAETGNTLKEIKTGVLIPLQKPGKKIGPCSNLRPIILLSVIRKIIAIVMCRRISDRLIQYIPKSQAAYQSGRSTTEQVFVMRTMAEKAIAAKDYTTHILMMDMSKAFDTVNRNKLINDLKTILEEDEIQIIRMLIENVELVVKVGKSTGKTFMTNTGVPQGDCLSPPTLHNLLGKIN